MIAEMIFFISFLVLSAFALWHRIILHRVTARLKLINPQDVNNSLFFNGADLRYSYFKKQIKNGVLNDPSLL